MKQNLIEEIRRNRKLMEKIKWRLRYRICEKKNQKRRINNKKICINLDKNWNLCTRRFWKYTCHAVYIETIWKWNWDFWIGELRNTYRIIMQKKLVVFNMYERKNKLSYFALHQINKKIKDKHIQNKYHFLVDICYMAYFRCILDIFVNP